MKGPFRILAFCGGAQVGQATAPTLAAAKAAKPHGELAATLTIYDATGRAVARKRSSATVWHSVKF